MSRSRLPTGVFILGVPLALAACGDGSSGPPPAPNTIRTVAYVVSECHEDARGATLRQSLQVMRGDQTPITVRELPVIHLPALGFCPLYGQFRAGTASVFFGGSSAWV
jgi:hypothetical protein